MPGWWQAFFHAPVDLTSLALFRILIGIVLTADAVSFARHAPLILHPDALPPFRVWKNGPDRRFFSFLRWLPESRGSVSVVIGIYGLAGVCVSVGFATPWATAVAFLAAVSLHHRNRHVLHSGDSLLRILTFLLIFSDAGAVLSIDAALAESPVEPGSPWALRLMQLQLASLYFISVFYKLRGRTWRRGTASHYASSLLAHRRLRLPAALDGIVAHRIATWSTLAVEFAGGTLIWWPQTRYPVLAGLAGLHLTLQLLMRMHVFQFTMLVSLILFVPGEDLAGLFGITPSP